MIYKYQAQAKLNHTDALEYYVAPLAYSQMQVLEHAINATVSLEDEILSAYCRTHTFETVMAGYALARMGNGAAPRVLQVQFQNIEKGSIETFKENNVHVVVAPKEYASGALIYPYSPDSR